MLTISNMQLCPAQIHVCHHRRPPGWVDGCALSYKISSALTWVTPDSRADVGAMGWWLAQLVLLALISCR